MSNPWTPAWAEAEATHSPDVVELYSIEILHPSIVDAQGNRIAIRAVNDLQDQNLPLEDTAPLNPGQSALFKAIPFDIPWPDTEDGKAPEAKIRIDNIGREVVPYLDAAVLVDAALQIIFRCHLWSNGGALIVAAMDPVSLELREVTINEQYVEGTASPADIVNLQFGRVIYDVENYPALTQ